MTSVTTRRGKEELSQKGEEGKIERGVCGPLTLCRQGGEDWFPCLRSEVPYNEGSLRSQKAEPYYWSTTVDRGEDPRKARTFPPLVDS